MEGLVFFVGVNEAFWLRAGYFGVTLWIWNSMGMARLRFLHIPKSAGTTFSNCLRRIYGAHRLKNNIFIFYGDLQKDIQRYRKLSDSERSQIILFSGHAPLITGEAEIDELPTITFLRDPVERVKSFCQAVSEEKVQGMAWKDFDLDRLLLGDAAWLRNHQTRMLLGVGGYELPGQDQNSLVEKAVDVIKNRLAGFGITERFEDSIILLSKELGWDACPIYTKLNQKNRSRELGFTDVQLSRIREINMLDIKVYEAALLVFEERINSHEAYFDSERNKMRFRQNIFGRFLIGYRIYHQLQAAWIKLRNKVSV